MSNNVNINGATDRTSIKCHKIYKDNRDSLISIIGRQFGWSILHANLCQILLTPVWSLQL